MLIHKVVHLWKKEEEKNHNVYVRFQSANNWNTYICHLTILHENNSKYFSSSFFVPDSKWLAHNFFLIIFGFPCHCHTSVYCRSYKQRLIKSSRGSLNFLQFFKKWTFMICKLSYVLYSLQRKHLFICSQARGMTYPHVN